MSQCLVVPTSDVRAFCASVLAVHDLSDVVIPLTPDQAIAFMAFVDGHRLFRERHGPGGVEEDPAYQQVIFYAVFVRGEELFVYQRGSISSAYSEQRLATKISIGIGGHIDTTDATLLDSLRREIAEEIVVMHEGIVIPIEDALAQMTLNPRALIKNESDVVNLVHVGLLVVVTIPVDWDIRIAEVDKHDAGQFMARAALDTRLTADWEAEAWTSAVLRSNLL